VGLEVKGLRRSRGRTAYAIAKEEFGLTGTKESVHKQLQDMVDEVLYRKAQLSLFKEDTDARGMQEGGGDAPQDAKQVLR
jgi:hypothetical protein